MYLSKKNAKVVTESIQVWQQENLISSDLSIKLQNSIHIRPFDWKKLAKYSLWISLICILIAVGSVLGDAVLLGIIMSFFVAPALVRFLILGLCAAGLFHFSFKRKLQSPHKKYTNEAIAFLGIMFTSGSIYQLGEALTLSPVQYTHLMFLSFIIYTALGVYYNSNLIWLFAILSLGNWLGAETGYMSGWGAYYLGMSFPMRFVLFGGFITAIALALENESWFKNLYKTTLVMGLLYLFISLWIMSIFGNYGDMTIWYNVKQIELFHWSLLFAAVAIGAIYHGLRYDNTITRGFGITFLFINLYTRYFEFFWDSMHKAIFFAILAIMFWFVGSRAEKIWHIGEK